MAPGILNFDYLERLMLTFWLPSIVTSHRPPIPSVTYPSTIPLVVIVPVLQVKFSGPSRVMCTMHFAFPAGGIGPSSLVKPGALSTKLSILVGPLLVTITVIRESSSAPAAMHAHAAVKL